MQAADDAIPAERGPGPGFRLLVWNILHGGGPARTPEILLRLLQHAPDVIVLTEARCTFTGQMLGALREHGWRWRAWTEPEPGVNGVVIAARSPVEPRPMTDVPGVSPHRFISASLPALGLSVTGVHVPAGRPSDVAIHTERCVYWRAIHADARANMHERHAIVGDFNTFRPGIDGPGCGSTCAKLLGDLTSLGYGDAWRDRHGPGREYSWYSTRGRGFRLDQALFSGAIRGLVRSASYDHEARRTGLSDHAPLLVDVGAGPAPAVSAEEKRQKAGSGNLMDR